MMEIERRARAYSAHEHIPVARIEDLLPRERDVVMLLAAGLQNAEIARRLCLQEQTIKNYVTSIYDGLRLPIRDNTLNPRVVAALWYWEQTRKGEPDEAVTV